MGFVPTKRVHPTQQVQAAQDSDYGVYLYKTAVSEVRPIWDQGWATFRVLPGKNPDTGYTTYDPMFINEAEPGLWIYTTHVVAGAGIDDRRVTFLMRNSFEGDDYNMAGSPYSVLYKAIKGMESLPVNRRVWSDMLVGRNGKGAALPNARKPSYFVQCIPYCRGDKTFNFNDSINNLHVMRMTSSAGEALRKAIDAKRAQDKSFDVTSLDQSWFVTLWNKKRPNPFTHEPGDPQALSYACSIDQTYQARDEFFGTQCILTDYAEKLDGLIKPWDQVLRFPSFEEQADWLCYAFDSVPAMIMYAFADHPDWISERIRRKASGDAVIQESVHPAVVANPTTTRPTMNTAGLPSNLNFSAPKEPEYVSPVQPLMPSAPWDEDESDSKEIKF